MIENGIWTAREEINVDENIGSDDTSGKSDVLASEDEENTEDTGEVLSAETEAHLSFTQKIWFGLVRVKDSLYKFFLNFTNIF